MKLASLAVARGERHLSLVRAPAPEARHVAALPAWRQWAGAVIVVVSLGTATLATIAWSFLT